MGPYRTTASETPKQPTGLKLWWKQLWCDHVWYVLEYVGQDTFTPRFRFYSQCVKCNKFKTVAMHPGQPEVEDFITSDMTEEEKEEYHRKLQEAHQQDVKRAARRARAKKGGTELQDTVNRTTNLM